MTKSRSNKVLLILMVPLLLSDVNGRPVPDDRSFQEMDSMEQTVHLAIVTRRTLKDDHGFVPPKVGRIKGQMVGTEDYDPIDPVPSSKTSVKHGPIQHNAPLIPFLPKPSPPNYPPSP